MEKDLTRLQTFVFSNTEIQAPEEMYFRCTGARSSVSDKALYFDRQGTVTTDTFYNGLSIGVWRRHCTIKTLFFYCQGQGKFTVHFGVHDQPGKQRWLAEFTIDLNRESNVVIGLPFWDQLEDGILYCQLQALSPGLITEGGFLTADTPLHFVKLGLVITHFNRSDSLVPLIRRMQENFLSHSHYRDKITVTVVDNSKNSGIESVPGINVIPSPNLGGSGGFTRGLLSLQDEGSYTHCLFMDDDTSFEMESIRRAYAFLQYTHQERFAVAGSLLSKLYPWQIYEKGARFNGRCCPLKRKLDMRVLPHLLLAEKENEKPDYGGWWFFAFAIKDVKYYPFPFFVKGDDIMFSLLHKPTICTNNGIGCFGIDFSYKSGPLTLYLNLRNHILQIIIALKGSNFQIAKTAHQFFIWAIFSYNYASARAITLALRDLSQGPSFFKNNPDISEVRREIAGFSGGEEMKEMSHYNYVLAKEFKSEPHWRRVLRWLTLNGFLLPSFMIKKAMVFQEKNFNGLHKQIFRHKWVLYKHSADNTGYVAKYNRKLFFKETIAFIKEYVYFVCNLSRLRREFEEALPEMTSSQFWREVYRRYSEAA